MVGRLRPPHDGPGRLYEERVDRMAGLRVDEVAAEPIQRGEARARDAEAERLRARLLPRARQVALDPAGRAPASSEEFAAWLARRMDERPVAFLVGGALGLARTWSPRPTSACPWARSRCRTSSRAWCCAEQLYRALCITAGHPYPH